MAPHRVGYFVATGLLLVAQALQKVAARIPGRAEVEKFRARRFAAERVQQVKPKILEIGAVTRRFPNTLTLDRGEGADVRWDIRKGLPFDDCTFSEVYSSHTLEHFAFSEALEILREVERVLISGGTCSVAVPNARAYIEAYMAGRAFRKVSDAHVGAYDDTGSPIDSLNYVAFMGGEHKILFDANNLTAMFRSAGFIGCRVRPFNSERDLEGRRHESLYVEGTKP